MPREKLLRSLLVVAAVTRKELAYFLRYPSWIFAIVAIPYGFTGLLYGVGVAVGGPTAPASFSRRVSGGDPFAFLLVGSAVFVMANIVMWDVGSSIRHEQLLGTLEYNYLTPANRVLLWGSVIVPHALISFVALVGAALPAAVTGLEGVGPLEALLALLLVVAGLLPLFGLGLFIAAVTMRFKETGGFIQLLNSVLALLSGYTYPLTVLPAWLQLASRLVPTSWVVEGLRGLLVYRLGAGTGLTALQALALLSAAYLGFGLATFRRWERDALRRGGLSRY